MAKGDGQQTIDEFNDAVNMTAKELEDWLQTDESKSVGQSDGGGESKGHESGRKIVEILEKNKTDYSSDDIDHMRRVVRCEEQRLASLSTQLGSRSLEIIPSETPSGRSAIRHVG
jgi:hypothetical protein